MLWLWGRQAATALIGPLAWEIPRAVGAAPEKIKKENYMTASDRLMLCGFSADVENLNSHNEAELRRQFEERQQETEHVYELLENKIQLLQEVSRGSTVPWLGVLFYRFPYCSAP